MPTVLQDYRTAAVSDKTSCLTTFKTIFHRAIYIKLPVVARRSFILESTFRIKERFAQDLPLIFHYLNSSLYIVFLEVLQLKIIELENTIFNIHENSVKQEHDETVDSHMLEEPEVAPETGLPRRRGRRPPGRRKGPATENKRSHHQCEECNKAFRTLRLLAKHQFSGLKNLK